MHKITEEERAVGERLRREIARSQPAFSEKLHDRLSLAVRQYTTETMATPNTQPASHWLSRITLLATALGLFLAVALVWQSLHADRSIARNKAMVASRQRPSLGIFTELAKRATAKTDTMIHSAVEAQRWACLDQDAKSVLQTPTARLPFDIVSSLLSMQKPKPFSGPSSRNTIHGS